ncbi:MAG: methyltransferase domain-containing protein [Lewinella sp.]|jgi:tRNA (cmo5U34)-methyltransferase|nr:methyltransferase domain-containing protein [Lewinella sp.]
MNTFLETTINQHMQFDYPKIFKSHRATGYDDFVRAYIPFYEHIMALLPKLIAQAIPEGNRPILVAGCGTGNELLALATAHPEWQLEGIDPSPEMITQARHKLTAYSRVRLANGYVSDLPLGACYGAVTLLFVLHFIPDDGAKLSLLRDVAKRMLPGAPLVLLDIFGRPAELSANLEVLKLMMPPAADPAVVAERLRTLPNRIKYIPERRLATLLEDAGFSAPQRFFQAAIYGGWIAYRKVSLRTSC